MKLFVAIALCVATAAAAQSSPAKKELVAKILRMQQPSIERGASIMVERPAQKIMQQAGGVLQNRVPAERRAAVAQDVEGDLKKYLDDAVPLVRERAIKIAPATIGPLLEEKFSEDELRQLVLVLEMLESPVSRKFEQMGPSIEKALAEKLDADMRSVIEPKVRALDQAVVAHLGGSNSAVGPIAPAGPVNPGPGLGSNSVLRLPKAMGK